MLNSNFTWPTSPDNFASKYSRGFLSFFTCSVGGEANGFNGPQLKRVVPPRLLYVSSVDYDRL